MLSRYFIETLRVLYITSSFSFQLCKSNCHKQAIISNCNCSWPELFIPNSGEYNHYGRWTSIYSYTGSGPGGFMPWRTAYSATQRRRATIFRPATAAAHLTYDRHISERQSLNTIFTRVNPSIRMNCVQRAVVK